MAKGNDTPHLDRWLRTFKNVGVKSGKLAAGILSSAAPGISSSANSVIEAGREAQSAYRDAKSKVNDQLSKLNQSMAGKNAQSILNDAFNDIKNGTFSLNKINDSSYDTIDDYDTYIDKIDVDATDPNSVAIGESKKNTALLGRTIAEGNVATINGLHDMTATLSNVQIKASQASTAKMSAVAITGFNQVSNQLTGVNSRLDVINKNVISLLDFQRNNVAVTNQAAVEYYAQSSQMMASMGAVISEMKDFMDSQRSMTKKRRDSDWGLDPYDMSYGFNYTNYKNLVKHNFKESSIGTMLGLGSMLGSVAGMSSSLGESPLSMAISLFGSSLIPKHTRKAIERLDKTFTSSIDEMLYRIGDMRYNSDILKSTIGSLLGKKRPSDMSKINLGNFKKDSMGWNGIAQKTLVEVIPSYLARIESSLTKSDERFYNMETGLFMTRKSIADKYQKDYKSTAEYEMQSFTEDLNKAFEKSKVPDSVIKSVYATVNDVANQYLSNTKPDTKALNAKLYNSLQGNVGANELRDLMMSFTENLNNAKKSISDANKSIEESISGSINRNLFNEGQSSKLYRRNINISPNVMYSKSGKLLSDLTDDELRDLENDKKFEEKMKSVKKSVKEKFFGKKSTVDKPSIDQRMASRIDNMTNAMYDKVYGFSSAKTETDGSKRTVGAASSAYSEKTEPKVKSKTKTNVKNSTSESKIDKLQSKIIHDNYTKTVNATESEINSDMANVDGIMEAEEAENKSSLKALVLGLYTNFLKPMASAVFGKNGLLGKIGNLFNSDNANKFKDKIKRTLFNEKDGVFGGLTSWFKDQTDYLKHVFTGKGYTKRTGDKETIADSNDSVFGHLLNGYDFVFKNTMKYIFGGDDYASNEKFQKYFKWMDIKGKRKQSKSEATVETKPEEIIEQVVSANKATKTKSNKKSRRAKKAKKMASKNKTVVEQQIASSGKTATDETNASAIITDNLVNASEQASVELIDQTQKLSDEIIGTDESINKLKKESSESITSTFKKHLPKTLAAGVVGSVIGASGMFHGVGLLGSLFLPTGPFTGAIAGMGLSILSRSKKFQEFLFGKEDKDGKKTNGLISNKTQEFVKNNLPLIVGTTALGALKGLIKGGSAAGTGGFLMSSLLPSGMIGGALVGLSIGLLKNNERFNKILFGEKAGKDGKERTGGMFSKGYNTMGRIFSKSGQFIKGGAKGLGIGVLTASTVGKLGVLGSALTAGGPIGWGIAGLGLGIAGQTKKFQELLFGTEEFDEDGNLKGRAGDGLLTKVRNMLVVNVFEPIKDKLQEKTEDFAFWLKKNITYPFRLAFGPILDSLKSIKKDISDVVHDAFNNIAETVGKTLKEGINGLFKPFTFVMKKAGKVLIDSISFGAKAALTPISVPLKIMSWMTRKSRRKAKGQETRSLIANFGDVISGIQNTWRREDVENADEYKGFGGRINKFLTHARDIRGGIDAAKIAYEQGLGQTGLNSLNHMNVARERAADKVDISNLKKNRKQWRNIDKYRRDINKSVGYADINFTAEKNDEIRKKLHKMGIDKDMIASDEDLRLFFRNKYDWKDKFDPAKNKDFGDIAKNGIKMKETSEQATARRNTAEYQKSVLSRFDTIVKEFTIIGARKGINRRKKDKVDLKSLKEIDKNLKEQGITWNDLGIDPGDLLNPKDLPVDDWENFMREKFQNGEVVNSKDLYASTVKRMLDRENNLRDVLKKANLDKEFTDSEKDINYIKNAFNQAGFDYTFNSFDDLVKWLDGNIKTPLIQKIEKDEAHDEKQEALLDESNKNTRATVAGVISDELENGASTTDVAKSTGFKITGKFRAMADSVKRAWKKKDALAAEAKKDEELRGSTSMQDGELVYNSATIDGVTEEATDEIKKKKGTVFSIFKEGLQSFVGSIFQWITNKSMWKVLGIGALLTGAYGGKVKEFFNPILSKVGTFIKEKGLPFLGKVATNVADFISDNLPTIIEKYTTNLVNNMGTIIQSVVKVAWAGLSTAFKMMANRLANALGQQDIFEINGVSSKGGQKFDSYNEALDAVNGDTTQIHQNTDGTTTVLDDNIDVDENGNAYIVPNTSLKSTAVREGIQFIRNPINRKLMKKTAVKSAKIAGTVTGVIPGAKLVKNIATGTWTLGKGIVSVGKAIKNNSKKAVVNDITEGSIDKAAKEAAKKGSEAVIEDVAEQNAEKAMKNIAKEGAEAATEGSAAKKAIKKFLESAIDKIKAGAKFVADKIPKNKFTKAVDGFCKTLKSKLDKASDALVTKVSERIKKKTGEATGKTAAKTIPIISLGFAIYDGINGALSASYLFGIDDSKVTAGMRVVSSILEILLGTAVGAWLDIVLEVFALLTGYNAKQHFARWLWKCLPGTDDSMLDDAITELELETKKYNDANGTKLSTEEYSNKKNSSTTIGGRLKKAATWIVDREKYNKTYNYDAYKVSDAELQAYKNEINSATISSNTSNYQTSTSSSYNASSYDGSDLMWGNPGRKLTSRAAGYGFLQSDNRWADFPLGRFPNGGISTMESGGCGPTALSMVANTYGSSISPLAVAKYAKNNGYIADGGSTSSLFTDGARRLGLKSKTVSSAQLKDELESGKPVILSGKSYNSESVYTSAGHVIKVDGYKNGYALVSDPMRGDYKVKLNNLTSGMTHGWSYSNAVGYGPTYSSQTFDNLVTAAQSGSTTSYSSDLSSNISQMKKSIDNNTTSGTIVDWSLTSNKMNSANNTNTRYNSIDAGAFKTINSVSNIYDYATSGLKAKSSKDIVKNSRWSSKESILDYIKKGYNSQNGKLNWNRAAYYNGLTIYDLKALVAAYPALLTDTTIPVFKAVYDKYVASNSYVGIYKLSTQSVSTIANGNILSTGSSTTSSSDEESEDKPTGFFDMISNLISKFASIATNFIDSTMNGTPYYSIYSDEYKKMHEESSDNSTDEAIINNNTTGSPTSTTKSGTNDTDIVKNLPAFSKGYVDGELTTLDNRNFRSTSGGGGLANFKVYGVGPHGTGLKDFNLFGMNSSLTGGVKSALNPNNNANRKLDSVLNKTASSSTQNTSENTATDDTTTTTTSGSSFTNAVNDMMAKFGAIQYAAQSEALGQDYEQAKQDYYTLQQNNATGTDAAFITTEDGSGSQKYVPPGYGSVHSYMGWQCITSKNSKQMKLRNAAESFDQYGFGKVGDRYAVAVKPYYGEIGDYLNITQTDGVTYKVAVADHKGNENGSTGLAKYIHGDNSMVEFVVDKPSWYGTNKTVTKFHPEWKQNIASIENVGNYWRNDSGDKATYGFGPFRRSRSVGYGYSWLQIVKGVKEALAAKKLGYSQTRHTDINVYGTILTRVRTDCSGFVSACLRMYGSMTGDTDSRGFVRRQTLNGFTKQSWPGWEGLLPGDIIAKNGHVEIFAKNENGRHYVYNCGSNSSCNNPGVTTDSRTYSTVWRPNEAGSLGALFYSDGSTAGATDTTGSTASTFISPFSSIGSLFSSMSGSVIDKVAGFGPGSSRTPAGWFTKTLGGRVTSNYGQRDSAFGSEFHRGIDISSSKGTSVLSPIDGVVVSSGSDPVGYGNYAVVQSKDGANHLFAHLNKPVGYGVGTVINKNDIIGEVGSTGKSTGDHLHYEIRRDGNKYSTLNPMEYKYDRDVGKNLNINKQNASHTNGIGSGSRDLSTRDLPNKLDVALNTHDIETKMDSLIEVMKTWAERDAEASKSTTQNNTNITTNNVTYGNGKKKTTTKTVNNKKDLSSQNLVAIHKAIAAKA